MEDQREDGHEVAERGEAGGTGEQAEIAAGGIDMAAIFAQRPLAHRSACVNVARSPCASVAQRTTVGACWRSDSPEGSRCAPAASSSRRPPRGARAPCSPTSRCIRAPHARAQLAARFWPDVLDESARTSLRAALSELRRALGPAAGHLVATRETVALDGAGLAVDTRAFDAALDGRRSRPPRWRRAARRSSTASRTTGRTTRARRTPSGSPTRSSSSRREHATPPRRSASRASRSRSTRSPRSRTGG